MGTQRPRQRVDRREHNLILGLLDGGNWIPVHLELIRSIGLEESVVLHYLINYHGGAMRSPRYEWDDGWFFCKVDRMEGDLGITPRTQRRIVKRLASLGLIETKQRGVPSKRYFRINTEEVKTIAVGPSSDDNGTSRCYENVTSECSENVTSECDETGTSHTNYNRTNYNRTNNKNGRAGKAARADATFGGSLFRDEFDQQMAGMIRGILVKYDSDLLHKRLKIDTLAERVAELRIRRKVSKQEIQTVLGWLEESYGNPWVPKWHKLDDIVDKWQKLRECRSRSLDAEGEEAEDFNRPVRDKLIQRVRSWLEDNHNWSLDEPAHQEDVDEALAALGAADAKLLAEEV